MKTTTFTKIINAIEEHIKEKHVVLVGFDDFIAVYATSFDIDEWDLVTMYKNGCLTCMAPISSIKTIRVVRLGD